MSSPFAEVAIIRNRLRVYYFGSAANVLVPPIMSFEHGKPGVKTRHITDMNQRPKFGSVRRGGTVRYWVEMNGMYLLIANIIGLYKAELPQAHELHSTDHGTARDRAATRCRQATLRA
jgi:hypothetical protein